MAHAEANRAITPSTSLPQLGETGYDFVYLKPDLESPEEHSEWKAGAATTVGSNSSHEKVDKTALPTSSESQV